MAKALPLGHTKLLSGFWSPTVCFVIMLYLSSTHVHVLLAVTIPECIRVPTAVMLKLVSVQVCTAKCKDIVRLQNHHGRQVVGLCKECLRS